MTTVGIPPETPSSAGPVVEAPLRPRTFWFWVGGLVIGAGVIIAIIWFAAGILGVSDTVADFERVPFDSGGTVVLDEGGGYVVYVEGGNVEQPGGRRISVLGPDGRRIPTAPYGGSLTYDFGAHAGAAVATFDAPAPGTYQVAVSDARFAFGDELAVGPSIAGDLVRTLVGAFAIGGIGVVGGVVVIVVTAVRRSRARRRRQTTPWPGGWAPPPPPAAPAPWHGEPLPPPT